MASPNLLPDAPSAQPVDRPRREKSWPASPSAASCARKWLRDQLSGAAHGLDLDDIELMVGEAVGNSCTHSRSAQTGPDGLPLGRVRLVAVWDEHGLRVEVTDEGGAEIPAAGQVPATAEKGRGLFIIAQLAHTSGFTDHEDQSRTLWLEVLRTPRR